MNMRIGGWYGRKQTRYGCRRRQELLASLVRWRCHRLSRRSGICCSQSRLRFESRRPLLLLLLVVVHGAALATGLIFPSKPQAYIDYFLLKIPCKQRPSLSRGLKALDLLYKLAVLLALPPLVASCSVAAISCSPLQELILLSSLCGLI